MLVDEEEEEVMVKVVEVVVKVVEAREVVVLVDEVAVAMVTTNLNRKNILGKARNLFESVFFLTAAVNAVYYSNERHDYAFHKDLSDNYAEHHQLARTAYTPAESFCTEIIIFRPSRSANFAYDQAVLFSKSVRNTVGNNLDLKKIYRP